MPKSIKELSFEEFDHLSDTMTDQKISQLLGCSKGQVIHYRRKLGVRSYADKKGIVIGVKGVSNPTNRKHFFNERFFQSIDSEIKAYALGLFLTDGHIVKTLHRARLTLTESDASVLKQIAIEAGLSGELLISPPREGNYQVYNMANLNFNSTLLVRDLLSLGLTPSKNTNLTLPEIPFELDCHLIRGLFDGDGHITNVKSFQETCHLGGLCGRLEFLKTVNERLAKHQIEGFIVRPMKSIWEGRLGKWNLPILDFCYGCDPKIAIPRKLERYKALKAVSNSIIKVR